MPSANSLVSLPGSSLGSKLSSCNLPAIGLPLAFKQMTRSAAQSQNWREQSLPLWTQYLVVRDKHLEGSPHIAKDLMLRYPTLTLWATKRRVRQPLLFSIFLWIHFSYYVCKFLSQSIRHCCPSSTSYENTQGSHGIKDHLSMFLNKEESAL